MVASRSPRLVAVVALLVGVTLASERASAQAVEMQNDSVSLRFTNTDLRAAIQSMGRFLDKPVLATQLGETRVEVFETPGPVPRATLPTLLRALVEAHGLVLEEDSLVYRVLRPEAPPPPVEATGSQVAATDQVFRLFAVRLRHARAADVAATLNQLYGAGDVFTAPAGLSTGSLSDELRADREGTGAFPQANQEPEGATLRDRVTIVPDEQTNTLLIRATQPDFDLLQEAIAQVDVRPLQVLIEVVIVEARKDRQFALGFNVHVPPQELDDGTIQGTLTSAGLGDLVVRVMNLGRLEVNATITAARLRGDVEILSRPVLLASNNTEARLLVGTQQPFIQMSRSLPTDIPQRDQVVQYRDVGTKLTMLPTINQDGYVSLLIQQEISAATGDIQFGAPVISSREAVTQVLMRDGQTVVIGGLQDEVHERVRTGVPLLVDIPLLGAFFGGTRTRTTEIELFLFITPTIIQGDEDLAAATLRRVPPGLLESSFVTPGPIEQLPIDEQPSGDGNVVPGGSR